MEEGVLCLKWRDHRSTFLRMLSAIRKKGAFCDATLVCEGKFYPVHQLVLSTCSEYFQQMFEVVGGGTSVAGGGPSRAAGPLVVVLTGVSPRDLEALLEYMYAGEATILQGDLARFMKAAEGLKVQGLAEPPPPVSPSASRREGGEGTKRIHPYSDDSWDVKRRKETGDNLKVLRGKEAVPDIVSPAQLASAELATETQRGMERDTATGTPGDLPGPVAPQSPPSRPQIKYEQVQVKDEPQHCDEMDDEKKDQGEWNPHQQQQYQHSTVLGEGAETAQLLGFCDPGLTYLAHTSGLGAVTDRGHSSHHSQGIQAATGWEAAGTSDGYVQRTSGHLRSASQRRMGRPISEIWLHYTTERAAGRTAVYCRYCSQKYGYPNATKMKIHTMKCAKCPEVVRRQFECTVKPESGEGQDITSARLGADGGVPAKTDSFPQYQTHQAQQTTDKVTGCTTNTAARSKSGPFRTESGVEHSSNSKAELQSPGNSSFTKSQKTAHQGLSSSEKASSSKPQPGQFANPEKSSVKSTEAKQRSCLSSPEKVKSPSRLQLQHGRPSSRSEDRVSTVPERLTHNPVI